jgi:hypothetical protein
MMTTPDVRGWTKRMLDRIAQLPPRFATARRDGSDLLFHVLRDLRTGGGAGAVGAGSGGGVSGTGSWTVLRRT